MKNLKSVTVTLMLTLLTGCALTITSDNPVESFVPYAGFIPTKVIGVQSMHIGADDDYSSDNKSFFQNGLTVYLQRRHVAKLVYPFTGQTVDFIISGTVSGRFLENGAANFLAWWPGPLVFAHGWHGTQFTYDATASVALVNTETGEIKHYTASVTEILKHPSANPFHVFGAVLMFPGMIKGGINTSPRLAYRKKMYRAAYSDLWKDISNQIASEIHDAEYAGR